MKMYLSGPTTGKKDSKAFKVAAERLRGLGFTVVNPMELEEPGQTSVEMHRRIAIRELTGCDLVVQLRGWFGSVDARLEEYIARRLGIECREYREMDFSEFENE